MDSRSLPEDSYAILFLALFFGKGLQHETQRGTLNPRLRFWKDLGLLSKDLVLLLPADKYGHQVVQSICLAKTT